MIDTNKRPAAIAELRKAVLDRCTAMLDRHLPASGELGAWKLGEMELELLEDVREIASGVIEARIGADPKRIVEKPKCPKCGLAFSPSGEIFRLRQGLL